MPEAALYDDLLMDHIKNARNYRALDDASHKATGTNPLCGDELVLYLRLDRNRIEDVTYLCTCCGISMASASIMTEHVKGKNASEVKALLRAFTAVIRTRMDPVSADFDPARRAILAAVRQFPARVRCAVLPWETLEAALESCEEATFLG